MNAYNDQYPVKTDVPVALIVTACHACMQVNPDDPMSVADHLVALVAELEIALHTWRVTGHFMNADRLQVALARMGRGHGV